MHQCIIVTRDGEYGGPLVMFTRDVSKVEIIPSSSNINYLPLYCLVQVVVLSPLNNFMVSSLHHNREERPSSLQWGLMGSVQVMTITVTSLVTS